MHAVGLDERHRGGDPAEELVVDRRRRRRRLGGPCRLGRRRGRSGRERRRDRRERRRGRGRTPPFPLEDPAPLVGDAGGCVEVVLEQLRDVGGVQTALLGTGHGALCSSDRGRRYTRYRSGPSVMTATVIPTTHANAAKSAALSASDWYRALMRAATSARRIATGRDAGGTRVELEQEAEAHRDPGEHDRRDREETRDRVGRRGPLGAVSRRPRSPARLTADGGRPLGDAAARGCARARAGDRDAAGASSRTARSACPRRAPGQPAARRAAPPDRPPHDHAEVDDRDLEQHEHEDGLPDHGHHRVYAIARPTRRGSGDGRRKKSVNTLHTALTRWG